MPPHHSTPNRSGGEAHLGHPRAPPSLFRLDSGLLLKSQVELIPSNRWQEDENFLFLFSLKMLFGRNLDHHKLLVPQTVISASNCQNIKSGQRLFGPQVWSYQSLPEHHQVSLKHCSSSAVWTKCLVISVTAWIPSSVLTALHFSGCLDYKFSHISRFLDSIECTYSAAPHWLFGLQV
ncbi:hypothetical protein TNIN_448701 [Trichonephila inaurata madagascariensis]|uniref:Uncharacterized protein n=1 Tax=Trichonephila inaurata madagascariensis TaxID=2747483 RepID=A0A8X7C5J0_9ARAC|nr:hypothetical protein TNIN_448701 [Trichonephila inaurata madagascariensis]